MEMDRSHWMYNTGLLHPDYLSGVQSFLKIAEDDHYDDDNENSNGDEDNGISDGDHDHLNENNYHLKDMFDDLETNIGDNNQEKLQQIFADSEKPVYAGCENFSKLDVVLELFNLKANFKWSDTSLLSFLHALLPKDNELPVSLYQAKKLMCPMGLKVERIHACLNDCMLFINEFEKIHKCVTCGASRYKCENETDEYDDDVTKNGPPAKLLWYLPIIPRLKRLFANAKESKLLRWHAEERKNDGKLRHVADSPQWRNINYEFQDFGDEIRNIRFGLNSDDINPFGTISGRHSPLQPGNDIDVYLSLLINDMKMLWSTGVNVYDAYKKENFRLRATIFCTISDFPAYGNLSDFFRSITVIEEKRKSLTERPSSKTLGEGLLLNIPGKTKDGIEVRKDLEDIGIRKELAPIERDNRIYLPPACYTMSKEEQRKFCKCLHGIKIPSSYSGNIKSNSWIITREHSTTITKLCLFFNKIHSKVIDPEELDEWKKEIIITLCELEIYFPPSFFDIMVHLISHIVQEIKDCGPVFLRYMYPFERYMGILKGYVRNRYRPDASIVEGYTCEEVTEFCTGYLDGVKSIGVTKTRHSRRLASVGVATGMRIITPSHVNLQLAHFVVLQHMTCMTPYIEEHMEVLRSTYLHKTDLEYKKKHNEEFSQLIKNKVEETYGQPNVDKIMEKLGQGPDFIVKSYQGYDINGYTYYTEKQDEKSATQNRGVTIIASTTEFDRMNGDTSIRIAANSYYGVIEEIWELNYYEFTIPLFKCKWVNNRTGVKVDEHGFTIVDLTIEGYKSKPFILASQATQVFFVKDPTKPKSHIVLQGKRRILGVDHVVDEEEYDQFDELPPFSVHIQPLNDSATYGTTYLWPDPGDGIYIDKTFGMLRVIGQKSRSVDAISRCLMPGMSKHIIYFNLIFSLIPFLHVQTPEDILDAKRLIFPGVRAFAAMMDVLNNNGMAEALRVRNFGKPVELAGQSYFDGAEMY
ncbi:uncharacterized protein LOC143538874 [Bidens hawaiensis]|uniref:uncharacterized protein LOC143538874 n=1 Tax=Bidens hawaiensis TaxID=980011 RepID=UPI0040492744